MKNSTRIILIVICSLLSLFLIGVIVWGIVLRESFMFGELKVVKEETISIDGITNITLNTKSADVMIYRTDEENVRVVQKSNTDLKEKDLFQFKKNGSSLIIDGNRGKSFCFGFCFFGEYILEVYVPNSYNQTLEIEAISGDITLDFKEGIFKNLKIASVSGDVTLNSEIKADYIELKSTSGDIETLSLECPNIKEQTISGDIQNEMINGKDVALKSTSGDIHNRWVTGNVDVSTISGEIEFDYFQITGNSKIKSTSGDIDVILESKSSVKMRADSVSGDIVFPHSESVIGAGEHSLSLETVSGDIEIKVTN